MDDSSYNQAMMQLLAQSGMAGVPDGGHGPNFEQQMGQTPGMDNPNEAPMTHQEQLQAMNRHDASEHPLMSHIMAPPGEMGQRMQLGAQSIGDILGGQTRSPIPLAGGASQGDPPTAKFPLPPNSEQAAMSREADALAASKQRKPMMPGINQAQHPGMNVDPNEQGQRDDWGGVMKEGLQGAGLGAAYGAVPGLAFGGPVGGALTGGVGGALGGTIGGLGGLADLMAKRNGRQWMRNP